MTAAKQGDREAFDRLVESLRIGAEIGDPRAGTFKQLVQAAEACPAECIHPGDPMNPKEKGLDKLIKRAEPFN